MVCDGIYNFNKHSFKQVFRFLLYLPNSVCICGFIFSNVLVVTGRTVGSVEKISEGPLILVRSEDNISERNLPPVGSEDKLSERLLLPVMQCVTVLFLLIHLK